MSIPIPQSESSAADDEKRQLMRQQSRGSSTNSSNNWFDIFSSNGRLPPSNPVGWPNSTSKALEDRPKRVIKLGSPQILSFASNNVKTSKYEIWNFLPRFLLEEFNPRSKMANCYFLMISGMQVIRPISNTNGIPTTLLPLLVVVFVDALFQIFEDISRHRADNKANASLSERFSAVRCDFEDCRWSDLAVGDIIRISNRDTIPADVVILSVSDSATTEGVNNGLCYVETKSLDGETNLKSRSALSTTRDSMKTPRQISQLLGELEMEHPNKLIESFSGVLDLNQGPTGRVIIQSNNILLRGTVLRNTDYVLALVINTGHDTKIMMSSTKTKAKISKLEDFASIQIGRIILLLAFVCFWGATGQALWNQVYNVNNISYLNWHDSSPISYWFVSFCSFFLLHATFIPVSLYVSMSMARYLQSQFMNGDLDMYDEAHDTPALVRTMTLNEELGQITHIFSDKTGTLTCNIMDFRKMSINGIAYGQGITEIGKAAWKLQGRIIPQSTLEGERKAQSKAIPHVCFHCPIYEKDMGNEGEQRHKINFFFRILAVCHDVIAEITPNTPQQDPADKPSIKYSASNPDDEALVCAAKYFGFEFLERKNGKFIVIHDTAADIHDEIEVLTTIAFTSKRKRMSVIIRDTDNTIRILCKGADTAILPRLKKGQDALLTKTIQQVNDFSTEGLRCLYIAVANLREKDFTCWQIEYNRVLTDLTEIEKRTRNEPNKIEELEDVLEQSFYLLGATGIEDKLQAGVPECIAELVQAGLNIWVLTGDKEETAINIAVACNLLQPKEYMEQIIINQNMASDAMTLRSVLLSEIQRYDADLISEEGNGFLPRALIVDGPSLITLLNENHTHEEIGKSKGGDTSTLPDLLLDLSLRCKAVVACRVSPDQKKQIVRLIKDNISSARTLAIGDGANDVAMIQAAHIGIGIRGEEGTQAVNSADYAIGQFRFLGELLLKHGRYNYNRMSGLVCYMFYKNILMSMAMFWYNFNCGFSGQKYYTEGAILLFNLAYTSIPIIMFAVYDVDVSKTVVHAYPQLYQSSVNSENFTNFVFWSWIASAVVESIVLSVLPLFTLNGYNPHTGLESTVLEPGTTCLTAIVIAVNIKMFFIQSKWYPANIVVILLSIGVFFASMFFINAFVLLDFNFFNVSAQLLLLSVFACLTYISAFDRYFIL